MTSRTHFVQYGIKIYGRISIFAMSDVLEVQRESTETTPLLPQTRQQYSKAPRLCLNISFFALFILLFYAITPSTWSIYKFTSNYFHYPGTIMFPLWIFIYTVSWTLPSTASLLAYDLAEWKATESTRRWRVIPTLWRVLYFNILVMAATTLTLLIVNPLLRLEWGALIASLWSILVLSLTSFQLTHTQPSNSRLIRGSLILLSFLNFLTFLTLAYRAREIMEFLPPGKLYTLPSGPQIHLFCDPATEEDGNRYPTVLFETGLSETGLAYIGFLKKAREQGDIGRWCFWDRPGYGWSDSAPLPASADRLAHTLFEVLETAGEKGPFLIVAHSFGGFIARVFTASHPQDVLGLILIDSSHEDQQTVFTRIEKGIKVDESEALNAWQLEGWPMELAWWLGGWGGERWLGLWEIADENWGKYDKISKATDWNSRILRAISSEYHYLPSLSAQAARCTRPSNKYYLPPSKPCPSNSLLFPPSIPLSVIASGLMAIPEPCLPDGPQGYCDPKYIKIKNAWMEMQKDLTTLSNNLIEWDVVEGAPHCVWCEGGKAEEMVIRAIGEMVRVIKDAV